MAWSPMRVSPAPCSARLPGGAAADVQTLQANGQLSGGSVSGSLMPGGTANRGLVIRVGDTVLRPTAPCRPATHALLAHLSAVGFDGAPRFLAGNAATEMLTYIDGRAAVPPLPANTLTDAALVSVAELLRRYHMASASFDPAGYRWPRPIPARFRTGLVSHNDVHPANLVFRDGRAVALIDFDLAGPGSAAWDFAAAARSWAPLQDDQDIADCRQGRALERFRIFVHASGLTRAERRHVAEMVIANHDWTYAIVTEAAAAGHQGFADHWRTIAEPAARARRWCQRHQRDLLAATR
jgi:Phosphotransferase enzyme family